MIKKNNELHELLKGTEEQHQNSVRILKEHLMAQMESVAGCYSQILSKIAEKFHIAMIKDIKNDGEVAEFVQNLQSFIAGKEELVKNQENFCKELENDLNQKKEALQFYQAKYNSLENERKDLINKALMVKKVIIYFDRDKTYIKGL